MNATRRDNETELVYQLARIPCGFEFEISLVVWFS